jgi:hypothetical protein
VADDLAALVEVDVLAEIVDAVGALADGVVVPGDLRELAPLGLPLLDDSRFALSCTA